MPLGMKVGLSPGSFVLDGDPAPLPKKGAEPPNFRPVYCGQTAGWSNMPRGTEVGPGSGNIVLDGDTAPPQKRAQPPIFGPCLLWPNGCMYQDTIWYVGRPQPRRHSFIWEPSSPSPKGYSPPNFRPMSVVAKRLDGLRCHLAWR